MNDIPATRSHCKAVGIMVHLNGGASALEGRIAFINQMAEWITTMLDLREESNPQQSGSSMLRMT
jgi:hypothetical protein